MAVEVLGVTTRVGHRTCTRAVLHVSHTGSLRGREAYYIRCECGDFVLSVCDVNGREHNIQQALIMCRRKSRYSEVE